MDNSDYKDNNSNRSGIDNNISTDADNTTIANESYTDSVGIAPAPDEVYTYRRYRKNPIGDIVNGQGARYIPDHAEFIKGKGSFVYYKAYKSYPAPALPSYRVPYDACIYAIAPIKRQIQTALRLLVSKEIRPLYLSLLLGKKWRGKLLNKICSLFNEQAMTTLSPWYMEDYYCPVTKEIINAIHKGLLLLGVYDTIAYRTAETIGLMFENDEAYAWRFQDAMTEADKVAMVTNAPKEINRLLDILTEREVYQEGMEFKYTAIRKLLNIIWKIPSIKRILRIVILDINFDNCKLTENDIYHTILYGSYNVQGKSLEERLKIYETYHGTDRNKWPMRINIQYK